MERVICREGTSRGRAAPWNIEKGATDTGQHVECLLYCVCACRREFGLVGGRRPRQNAEECCGEKVGCSRASGRWSPPLCVLYLSRLYNKMRRAHRPAFFSPFAQNIVHLHAMRCVSHGSRRSLCTLTLYHLHGLNSVGLCGLPASLGTSLPALGARATKARNPTAFAPRKHAQKAAACNGDVMSGKVVTLDAKAVGIRPSAWAPTGRAAACSCSAAVCNRAECKEGVRRLAVSVRVWRHARWWPEAAARIRWRTSQEAVPAGVELASAGDAAAAVLLLASLLSGASSGAPPPVRPTPAPLLRPVEGVANGAVSSSLSHPIGHHHQSHEAAGGGGGGGGGGGARKLSAMWLSSCIVAAHNSHTHNVAAISCIARCGLVRSAARVAERRVGSGWARSDTPSSESVPGLLRLSELLPGDDAAHAPSSKPFPRRMRGYPPDPGE